MAQTKVKLVSNGVITVDNLHTNHGITTDHIGEGSVLYYTDARVQNYLTTNNYIKTTDVASLETTTSLSLNANVLSYVDEAGTTTNIDLSLYLDDTNLARLVSGTLDGGTGIATFTRDDASTFTVDFSAFLSDANDYVTSASFNTADGVLTLTRLGGGTVAVDLDNRYLTSFTETDPIYTASSWYTTTNNASNWDTAYGWGNHASAGYLTSFTESDPVFSASAASGITSTNISNWNTAYGWGNHASAGYQPSSTAITTSNIGSQSVNYATSAGSTSNATEASYLDVEDTRAGQRMPTDVPEYRVSAEFTNQIVGGWHSLINVKGWHDGYASWQLIGGSDTSTHTNLYFRTGVNSSWGNLNKIWHDGNDGAGSGLDADLLDGNHASAFALASHTHNYWSTTGGDYTGNYKIGRHFDAQDVWDTTGNNRKALFLGWFGDKIILGNNDDSVHDTAVAYNDDVVIVGNPLYSHVQVSSPIYYDSNNTGYYVDPAGTSNLNKLNITTGDPILIKNTLANASWDSITLQATNEWGDGNIYGILGGEGNDGIMLRRPHVVWNNGHASADIRLGTSGGNGGNWVNFGVKASNLGFIGVNDSNVLTFGGASSRITSVNGHDAPIFYDSNNTGYYCDPASITNLSTLRVNASSDYYSQNYFYSNQGGYSGSLSSPGLQAYSTGNNSAYMSFHKAGYYAVNMGLDSDNVLRIGGWSAAADRWVLDMSGNNWTAGSMRSPIFYDSNDTNTYFDSNRIVTRGTDPTLILRDTNHRSSMLHCNSNRFYILSGVADSADWTQINGQWPAYWQLDTNQLFGGGAAFFVGDVTANTSDRRLKENIKNIPDAIEKVKSLNGVTFDWKDNLEEIHYTRQRIHDVGVIAQEVQAVLPDAVRPAPFDTDEEGNSRSGENYLTVQYEKIVPLLIEAIKEQQKQIEELKQLINK